MRKAGRTFFVNERSVNERSMLDENQNELKSDSTLNDMEIKATNSIGSATFIVARAKQDNARAGQWCLMWQIDEPLKPLSL